MPTAKQAAPRLLASVAFTLFAPAAWAEEPPSAEHADGHRPVHADTAARNDEIIVSAHLPTDFGLLSSTASISGDALVSETRGQLGETLARLPGVSATSFVPGASRPVLRGFDGDRIRVLVDGIGSIDASSVSADHAVVFDALTVDHIDVLHGPAVLLFGGQAIGGAINALDKRIPRRVPDALEGTVIGGYGSAADERSVAGALDVPLAPRLVAHLDASWRKSDDLRVGGFVNSPALRDDLLHEAEHHREDGEADEAAEFERLASLSGRVPNSAARALTLGAGLAFIDTGGNLGVSVQRYDTRYGVPLRPGAGHAHGAEDGESGEEGRVAIDLVQTRVDLRGALNLGGAFESLQFRGAYGDYEHLELEGDEPGTRFAAKGFEFRSDLVQREHGGWRGRSGLQVLTRKMTVAGDEAFVPDNRTDRFGLFTLQAMKIGGFEIEAAGRYERASITSGPAGYKRGFDLWSGAAGISYTPAEHWKVGANYIRGARAPAPEELLSNGGHVATQAYEIGDRSFGAETSDGVEVYLRYTGERATLSLTGYRTEFDAFITALPTDEEIGGLPVFRYAQVPARFQGFELSGSFEALRWSGGSLSLDGAADYTQARLTGIGPVPRIPPLRLRGGAEVTQGALHLRGEVEWNDAQRSVSAFESIVLSFTRVNLAADWHPFGEDGPLTLVASADNLFDTVGRRAASFTRDFLPLAGRDVRLTAKISF